MTEITTDEAILNASALNDAVLSQPLMILYRGPLTSCSYDCGYCPFAKTHDTPATLRADAAALDRFVGWAEQAVDHRLTILFTPWGEALTRLWYRATLVRLSRLEHVDRVAVQTNAAVRMDWVGDADLSRLALWTTYHPGQVDDDRFLATADDLLDRGVRFSVGVVGLPEHLAAAQRLRRALPEQVYLWVNAAEGHRYTAETAAPWRALDPLFDLSLHPHASHGEPCRTGESVISVDGAGDVRRCHFVRDVIGNLYDGSYRAALRPRECPNLQCDCHIGYLHLDRLELHEVFAGGLAERIPRVWPTRGTPLLLAR